jgi:predicted dehydrogenase
MQAICGLEILMRPIGVAIVGTGFGARVVLPALESDCRVRVVALLGGADRARTQALAEAHGIGVWGTSFEAVCARDDVDLVAIATPHAFHYAMVREALAARKHVLCEKTLGLTLNEAEDLARWAAACPGLHLVNLQLRFHPAIRAMGQTLRAGRIGRPYEAQLLFRTDRYLFPSRAPRDWWFDPAQGGGLISAVGPHFVDLVDEWFGLDVESMHSGADRVLDSVADGAGGRLDVRAESAFSCALSLRNGPRVWLSATAVAPTPTQLEISVLGAEGELRLRAPDTAELYASRNGSAARETLYAGTGRSVFADAFSCFAKVLVDALALENPAPPDGAVTFERYVGQHRLLDAMRGNSGDESR